MGTVTSPPPHRSDDDHDVEALEALIEEARRRARRRRRGYAAAALAAVAAGVFGFYDFSDGGGATGPTDRAEPPRGGAQLTDGKWRIAPGLEGASISRFAVDPQHPKTVFAATMEGGVFKSANGGRTWRQLDLGSEVSRVDTVAIAPGDPQTVYAGTGRGVLTTTNGGRSWQATGAGILGKESAEQHEHRGVEGYVYALAVDQRDADVAYAGTWGKGLFKTEDGGRHWQRIGRKAISSVNTLASQPGTSGVIYAGGRGVYRSRDGGATWHSAGLRSEYVMTLALDPKHPQTIYAGTMVDHPSDDTGTVSGDIFKTTDGGASWRSIRRDRQPVPALAVDPHDTDIVYAETWENVLKTADGGRTWRSLDAGGASSALAVDPRNHGAIYVGAGAGVSKSVDGGRSWRPMNSGLTAARVSALAVAPGGGGTAYAVDVGRGVFKRVDGRWRAASTGLTFDEVHTAVAVDPRDPANVFAGTARGVFRSTNGGASWSASSMTEPLGGWPGGLRLSAIAVDPKNSRIVYAIAVNDATRTGGGSGIYESLAFKSMDGGRTWPTLASVQSLVAPSTPGGYVFENVHTSRSALAIDPVNPNVLYAGGLGVVKSSDGGLTWRRSGLVGTSVLGLAVDPSEPRILYAGTDAGAFKSRDAGSTWLPLLGALDGVRVEALAIDPEHHRTVFAGTDGSVLWSTDGGLRWHRFTRLPHRPFDALAVDRSTGVLYAGAYGGGIYELKLAR